MIAEQITTEEVAKRLKHDEEIAILDVRENGEVITGKIFGAIHIPFSQLFLRKEELDKHQNYIVVCQSGNRSKAASGVLKSLGYQVEDMAGGMNNWKGEVN